MPGLLARPKVSGGLLQKIIWDRVRQGLLGTEGGGMGMEGGGGRGQAELPLSGGRAIETPERARAVSRMRLQAQEAQPTKYKWEDTGGGDFDAKLPSGVRISVNDLGDRSYDVQFWPTSGLRSENQPRGTRRSIERFSEVFDALREFRRIHRPRELSFSAASEKHEKVYDRAAPLMAKEFGAKLRTYKPNEYSDRKYMIWDIPE